MLEKWALKIQIGAESSDSLIPVESSENLIPKESSDRFIPLESSNSYIVLYHFSKRKMSPQWSGFQSPVFPNDWHYFVLWPLVVDCRYIHTLPSACPILLLHLLECCWLSMLQGHPYHPDHEMIMVKMVLIPIHSMNKDWEHFTTIRYQIDLSAEYNRQLLQS